MRLISNILFFMIAITIVGCGGSKYATKAKEGETEMMLSKGVCFGKCPVYTLRVKKGGVVYLDAKNNVPGMLGKYEKKIDKETYKQLLQAFKESDFAQYPADFESQIPDLPLITIGYMTTDTLQITRGKEDRPSSLMQLQYRLENLVKGQDWTLLEAYDRPMNPEKEDKPAYILSELIILPKPGTQLPRWFKEYEEYGLRVLKRITPNQNYWLVTYNQGLIKPDDILAKLKADERILEAEFNKETSNRGER